MAALIVIHAVRIIRTYVCSPESVRAEGNNMLNLYRVIITALIR